VGRLHVPLIFNLNCGVSHDPGRKINFKFVQVFDLIHADQITINSKLGEVIRPKSSPDLNHLESLTLYG
jgi:hypothetical protein